MPPAGSVKFKLFIDQSGGDHAHGETGPPVKSHLFKPRSHVSWR